MNKPIVTFGIVNCNRLYYLKSCLESLIYCTSDFESKEIIVVDNASAEEGTDKYLCDKEAQGIRVIRQSKRDPSNEFARALNIICKEAKGELIAPIQGDMQFILNGGWLHEYVKFFKKYKAHIGCILFDAQRLQRSISSHPYGIFENSMMEEEFKFYIDGNRPPMQCAADCMYSREILEKILPWSENNSSHEGGGDSETKMLQKIKGIFDSDKEGRSVFTILPRIPVSAGIYTDPRGTNARVRGDLRYGKYWPPKEDFVYYKIIDYKEALKADDFKNNIPLSIEQVAQPVGWKAPLDSSGNWMKNPIDPNNCSISDHVSIPSIDDREQPEQPEQPEHISDWLEE